MVCVQQLQGLICDLSDSLNTLRPARGALIHRGL